MYVAAQNFTAADEELRLNHKLVWPKEYLMHYVPDGKGMKSDLHLAIEYAEGDSILGGRFKAPRSNRFYFVYDPNGGKLR